MNGPIDAVTQGQVPFGGREPMLAKLHDYWRSKCAGRTMPARRDIDMVEIDRTILPYIILHDIVRSPDQSARPRYRYRLIGTELVNAIGADVTNRFLDDVLTPERGGLVWDWLDAAERSARPMTLDMPLAYPDREFRHARRIVLPLSDCGKRPDILMCCVSLG
ncbi:MAG: PAS domain-containing protein [Rhodospirillales bacterium]|nr:PAS domain-containing protein [Rhodospirillales bacterium]